VVVGAVAVAVALRSDPGDAGGVRVAVGDAGTAGDGSTTTAPDGDPSTTSEPPVPTSVEASVVAPRTTVTAAPPATAAPAPVPAPAAGAGGRHTITADPGGWSLVLVDRPSGGPCFEVEVSTFHTDPLLCGSGPAAAGQVVGDLVSFDTPIGAGVLAIVEPSVERWGTSPYSSQFLAVVHDPLPGRSGFAYAVTAKAMTGLGTGKLWYGIGENVIGRTSYVSSSRNVTIPPGQSLTTTDRPYGVWPGYRWAGSTGFYWGGNEELGFYDGPGSGAGRCLLFRRLGGDPEAMLLDRCASATAPANATKGIVAADLLPVPEAMRTAAGPGDRLLVVLTDGLAVKGWRCEVPSTGSSCGGVAVSSGSPPPPGPGSRQSQLLTDPAPGSGRQAVGTFPSPMPSYGDAPSVRVVLLGAGGAEVGRVTIPTS
jgi:hypothetical protein